MLADAILDIPERGIDTLERALVRARRPLPARQRSARFCSSSAELAPHVGQLGGIGDARALMRRMVILSSSSPGEIGTRMSLMAPW